MGQCYDLKGVGAPGFGARTMRGSSNRASEEIDESSRKMYRIKTVT